MDLKNIKLLVCDCDGVLTDGRMIYHGEESQIKNFSARDGMGFMILSYSGITPAVVTGSSVPAIAKRCSDLHIEHCRMWVRNKRKAVEEIQALLGVDWSNTAVMGDDYNDLPMLMPAAFSAAPTDADELVKTKVHHVTTARGGHGAVREIIEYILKQQGRHEEVLQRYLDYAQGN